MSKAESPEVSDKYTDLPNKVFVGNLAFKVSDEDLKTHFETAGKVVEAQIITRFNRSSGYGFVAFETLEEAEKAVKDLHQSVFHERELNVELARPKVARLTSIKSKRQPRKGRGKKEGEPSQKGDEEKSGAIQPESVTAAEVTKETSNEAGKNGKPRSRKPKPRKPRTKTSDEPSETTLFVANLPFSLSDEGLKQVFADFDVKNAHVVRKFGKQSKGYGFVELASHTEQQRALKELAVVEINERTLNITVAHSVIENSEGDKEDEN